MPTSIAAINSLQIPESNFVGRETEINLLVEALNPIGTHRATSSRIAVIYGEPGSGKSELARTVVYRMRRKFADGQLSIKYNNFAESYSAIQYILETVIHSLDPFARLPDSLNDLRDLYTSLLERKRILIHVDRVVSEDSVSLLIPPQTCALLLTTQFQLDLPEAFNLHLGELPTADAEHLLISTNPDIGLHASELANLCRNSPLALCLSRALLMSESSLKVVDHVRELREQINQNNNYNHRQEAFVELFIRQNCDRLDEDSQQIFYQLGVFSDSFTQAEAAAATGFFARSNTDSEDLITYLDSICHLNLITFDEANKRYRMSDSVRNFAVKHLAESVETHLNLAYYYGELAEDCAMLAQHGSDGLLLSLLLFDDFKPNFRQIWSWLNKYKQVTPYVDGIILKLSKVLASFGRLRFIPTLELIPQLKAALESAQRLKESEGTSSLLGELGKSYYILGEGHMALDYYEQQLNTIWVRNHREEEDRVLRDINLAELLLDQSS